MLEQETFKNIRNKNLSDILQVLREKGASSLSELTENTDSGLTTVKKCIFQAMDSGMVFEGEIADSTGGRKAKQYLINESYQYFLIIIVDNNNLIVKLYNFKFTCVEENILSFTMNNFYKIVCLSIEEAIRKYPVGTVCLSLPCVVKDGIIIDWYYNQRLNNFNIRSEIEKKYRLNVIVQNDMKLSVLGESALMGSGIKNIATIQFGHNGVGMAGMVNGHLLEGCRGFAGEVGYINDISKNIMSISYPAKIVRNTIVFINPEVIVFYKSDTQNSFSKIIDAATKELPIYAVPKFEISDNYIADIVGGSIALINKYGFFQKVEVIQ